MIMRRASFKNAFCLLVVCFVACSKDDNNNDDSECPSPLERARQLQAPVATSTLHGETEGSDFWANHSAVLKEAWKEWESQQDLPDLTIHDLVNNTLRAAVQAAWNDPRKEDAVKQLWTEVVPNNVYKCQLFHPHSIHKIRQHVDRASYNSNIPIRRPNGMNRYGLILHPSDDTDGSVVLQQFNSFFSSLLTEYARPMGRALFPAYVSRNGEDDAHAYAFTIRYKEGEDVTLQEHSDASLYTMNINLNLPKEDYEGSSLYFVDTTTGVHTNVTLESGVALLHLGMTRHAALPIQGGSRTNMVVWLYGKHGDVRIAPYDTHERLSRKERWSKETIRNNNNKQEFDFEL